MADAVNRVAAGEADASLLVDEGTENLADVQSMLEAYPSVPVISDRAPAEPELTVLDRRESSSEYLLALKGRTTVIGFDEGGKGRGFCDYLMDTFPAAGHVSEANVNLPAATAPRNRRTGAVATHESIIVTFGGEDPAGLTPLYAGPSSRKHRLRRSASPPSVDPPPWTFGFPAESTGSTDPRSCGNFSIDTIWLSLPSGSPHMKRLRPGHRCFWSIPQNTTKTCHAGKAFRWRESEGCVRGNSGGCSMIPPATV